jgi:hypothetical protein
MLIHGYPITASLPTDPHFKDRFWYWSGASGRKYIHSVYALDECPPLPGAIYVAVRREGTLRVALGIGRFTAFWDGPLGVRDLQRLEAQDIDEIHVHLLAKSPEAADAILQDLVEAFDGECAGMAEAQASVTGIEIFAAAN